MLAGAGGFEPPHGGIKIRCLTTWLRPIRTGRPAWVRPARARGLWGAPPVPGMCSRRTIRARHGLINMMQFSGGAAQHCPKTRCDVPSSVWIDKDVPGAAQYCPKTRCDRKNKMGIGLRDGSRFPVKTMRSSGLTSGARAKPVLMESASLPCSLFVRICLAANRYVPSDQVRGHASLENARRAEPALRKHDAQP
jgi:hypothetical protein